MDHRRLDVHAACDQAKLSIASGPAALMGTACNAIMHKLTAKNRRSLTMHHEQAAGPLLRIR
jgi:hypothetical protein